jgi:hypothetical protein
MVNNELDRIWKDSVVSVIEVMARRLPGVTETTRISHADVSVETMLPLSPEGHSFDHDENLGHVHKGVRAVRVVAAR